MDRFGEIDTTAKMLQTVVGSATDWAVLNANDQRIAKLSPSNSAKTIWYGHSKELQHSFLTDDELHHQDNTSYSSGGNMFAELINYNDKAVKIILNGILLRSYP